MMLHTIVRRGSRRQRLWSAVVVLLVTACAVVLVVSFTSGPGAGRASALGSGTPASLQPLQRLAFGMAYGDTLTFDTDQQLDRALDDAVALGVTWVRTDLSWEDIQPDSPDKFQWQRFGRVLQAARARGLNVLPTISYTPPWERQPGCTGGQSCAPVDPAAFAAFAREAAARYAPMGVHVWEIWNEPNIGFWAPQADPVAYTALLQVTSKAIRSVDPQAYLVMGGLAAVSTDPSRGYLSQTDFLAAVSKLGANRLVNAIGYHPYNYPTLPSATTSFGTPFQRISDFGSSSLEAVLAEYGTPDMPIWITETGAPTDGPGAAADSRTVPPNSTHVTEAYQAALATDTVQAAAANPFVYTLFWYTDQDSAPPTDPSDRSKFYGLRRYDGTRKPAFAALKDAIAAYQRSRAATSPATASSGGGPSAAPGSG